MTRNLSSLVCMFPCSPIATSLMHRVPHTRSPLGPKLDAKSIYRELDRAQVTVCWCFWSAKKVAFRKIRWTFLKFLFTTCNTFEIVEMLLFCSKEVFLSYICSDCQFPLVSLLSEILCCNCLCPTLYVFNRSADMAKKKNKSKANLRGSSAWEEWIRRKSLSMDLLSKSFMWLYPLCCGSPLVNVVWFEAIVSVFFFFIVSGLCLSVAYTFFQKFTSNSRNFSFTLLSLSHFI